MSLFDYTHSLQSHGVEFICRGCLPIIDRHERGLRGVDFRVVNGLGMAMLHVGEP